MYCDYLKLLLEKYLNYMQDQGLRVELATNQWWEMELINFFFSKFLWNIEKLKFLMSEYQDDFCNIMPCICGSPSTSKLLWAWFSTY